MADDSGREIDERRAAAQVISMLPPDPEAAMRVLDYTKELVDGFLRPRAPARLYSIKPGVKAPDQDND